MSAAWTRMPSNSPSVSTAMCRLRPFSVSGASAPSRLALDGSGCFGGPDPGQQFAEAAVGPVINELGQHVEQVGLRIDAVQFASLDQRGEHRPIFRPFVAAGEERILAIEGNRSHRTLDGI